MIRGRVAGSAIVTRFGGRFPLGTLVINVTRGYTTFSSFEWETYTAVREGARWSAILNIVSSVALGYAAVRLGVILARR